MARQFCCCKSNLFAAKILAIVFVVLHVIQLGIAAYGLANFDDIIGNYTEEGDNKDTVKLLFQAQCLKITQNVAFEFLNFGIFHHFLSY